jgi:hypothetical protein
MSEQADDGGADGGGRPLLPMADGWPSCDEEWPSCDEDGCSGVRTGDETRCLAHVGADERGATLKRFSRSGELDVRGVTISDALLGEIFDAMPHDADGHLAFSVARFRKATFEGDAQFGGATFEGDAGFGKATFKGAARFDRATFKGAAIGFDEATFEGAAQFGGATFMGAAVFRDAKFKGNAPSDKAAFGKARFERDALFDGATFERDALFDGATFKDAAGFGEAMFEGAAQFGGATFMGAAVFRDAKFKGNAPSDKAAFGKATFERDALFDGATFERDASFTEATFKDAAGFYKATFEGNASFDGATFEGDAGFGNATFKSNAGFARATFRGDVPLLGPIAVSEQLNLDGVQFASTVRIEADASVLTCRRGRFPGGVQFEVSRALVRLDYSDLSVPSLLTGPVADEEAMFLRSGGRVLIQRAVEQPRLLSLQRANVAGLALGNVDLADCRFAGAHNLDKLRLEAGAVFGFSPAVAGWERRHVIAEEAAWRIHRAHTKAQADRWSAPDWPASDDKPKVLTPGAVAVLYRALRKSREDAKNEPGAADFYYGEMEMRRYDRPTGDTNRSDRWRGRTSRLVLTAYWLFSGYGLRAWRSLAALAVVMAVSAAVFRLWGFTHSISYPKSLLFAFRSTLSLTDAQVTLTAWGGLFQAILRLTGPVLLALALLALRGRVKR